ncbi:transcriptional regulator LeuO [Salmonella enterica subsp. enterica]|nr:transcriptional regulator LeuO [Salmonella enterica subsp. enterica serovar Newport]EAB5694433.1 transcriptional regulator LeuO [Salmonella enterica subsp. enterica serovar Newport]EBU6996797.1 transcriptional regulator LeuO [Salmonella enterica subsp. enterica serovar Newport]EEB7957013.1 transcriptional regulator LeuO [Salmonella enterica subsp. enterica serovar Newport]
MSVVKVQEEKYQVNPWRQLRRTDLNLLTIFAAVMQERNITYAAHTLGMTQPAVSNAVSRLKLMFNDELFSRDARGVKPTVRACQIFSSISQALQLVHSELQDSEYNPAFSKRVFNLCVDSPLDNILTPRISNYVEQIAPNVRVFFKTSLNQNSEHDLRNQKIEFIIGYNEFHQSEFTSMPLFKDEIIWVASCKHPRIRGPLSECEIYNEQHAAVFFDHYASFSRPWYDSMNKQSSVVYQGTSLIDVLSVVSQTHLVAIVPRWLAEQYSGQLNLRILPLPLKPNSRTCFLSWNEVIIRDKSYQWMKNILVSVCQ